jgi:hypothetical protein
MQIAIPVEVTNQEITREKTLGGAIALCVKAAGLEPKEAMDALRVDGGKAVDKAQWSRWESGQEGIVWPKLCALMDLCGNDSPVLWMLQQRGYDLTCLRKRESETERELRQAQERIRQLEHEREVERRLFRELRST